MNLLALDTSYQSATIVLHYQGVLYTARSAKQQHHCEQILPLIDDLLKRAHASLQDLQVIGYGHGPGRFTGLRVACSIAQGLAFPFDLPVVGVSSLALLAQTAVLQHDCNHILVAVDAKMDQLYFASFTKHATGYVQINGKEAVYNLGIGKDRYDQLGSNRHAGKIMIKDFTKNLDLLKTYTTPYVGIGDGWMLQEQLETFFPGKRIACQSDNELLPQSLVVLTQQHFLNRDHTHAYEAKPNYLR